MEKLNCNMVTFYEVLSVSKQGGRYVWNVKDDTGSVYSINTTKLKGLIKNNQVYNASIQGNKVVQVPHAVESLCMLAEDLRGSNKITVEFVKDKPSGRCNTRLFNEFGDDITYAFYCVITRRLKDSDCFMTENCSMSLTVGVRLSVINEEINMGRKLYGIDLSPLRFYTSSGPLYITT